MLQLKNIFAVSPRQKVFSEMREQGRMCSLIFLFKDTKCDIESL